MSLTEQENADPPRRSRVHRWSYGARVRDFFRTDPEQILGALTQDSAFAVEANQKNAWIQQIDILKNVLSDAPSEAALFFEYSIPRLGRRIDVVLILRHVLFVLEFKVGERQRTISAVDQTWDYALDLKNFHEPSHSIPIAPILVATKASSGAISVGTTPHDDQLIEPIFSGTKNLKEAIAACLSFLDGPEIDISLWERGRYQPTPTIVEAAKALYAGHDVQEISRSDAGAQNLAKTSQRVCEIIKDARATQKKCICFVTGVPGAGKTLVGLDVATRHIDQSDDLYSVFLSGNGPLVDVLREALARDEVAREEARCRKLRIGEARSKVKMFIQNVHHFRDDCLADIDVAPIEHVALFDEAQRAWDLQQTASFMKRKKAVLDFDQSEPEFLISCLDRHKDWAVVVCLVGSGQEINTGEAGIREWLEAIQRRFKHWQVYLSPSLTDIEYQASEALEALENRPHTHQEDCLHLATSVRSFRSEHLSSFVNELLALNVDAAQARLKELLPSYPVRISRDLAHAKAWLRQQARGSERYGMIVSSQAQRLKPHAIDVRVKVDPVKWFLSGKEDTRSSFYLEDVATEFQVQGLELDWACVVWDGDLRLEKDEWSFNSFWGSSWKRVLKPERRRHLLNAYRVLLTRARQGLVIVVPEGDPADPSRRSEFYDPVFQYLKELGVPVL